MDSDFSERFKNKVPRCVNSLNASPGYSDAPLSDSLLMCLGDNFPPKIIINKMQTPNCLNVPNRSLSTGKSLLCSFTYSEAQASVCWKRRVEIINSIKIWSRAVRNTPFSPHSGCGESLRAEFHPPVCLLYYLVASFWTALQAMACQLCILHINT